jgi:beta-xylosidase
MRSYRSFCKVRVFVLVGAVLFVVSALIHAQASKRGVLTSRPIFRDPVHDGAADPSIIWNKARKEWWMFYTNRRADMASEGKDVSWVHGTRIGIAVSKDGARWKYKGVANISYGAEDYTQWAPEVIEVAGMYHMYLTIVPGTFSNWNHPREIIHLTSPDLERWTFQEKLSLSSEKVIDPAVFQLPNGIWRLWYKDEADGSHIHFADSTGREDLSNFTPTGVAVTDRSSEAPKVFWWHGQYWLLTDTYTHGLGVYSSKDATHWTRQQDNLLEQPGTQPSDRSVGHHPDVVISNDGRAYLYYFTHMVGPDLDPKLPHSAQRTVMQVTELHEKNGVLSADRNAPTYVYLPAPTTNPRTH